MSEENVKEEEITKNLVDLITDFERGKLLPLISLLEKKNIITKEELLQETVILEKEMEKKIIEELSNNKPAT